MTSKNTPFRIAIAGLGTVGATTAQIITQQREMLAARCHRPLEVVAVSSRSKDTDRGFSMDGIRWESDPLALATAEDVDVVVETIGGSEGIAKSLVESALAQGKAVVTANKALMAEHALPLAKLAEKHDTTLAFEAAVAGGIPIIKTLREGLAANRIEKVVGILNGTSNFILTHMQNEGSDFDEALKEASRLGYAEADPSFDVDGIDAGQKLSLISALAFGCKPNFSAVHLEGIRHLRKIDMQYAAELGYNIKLLGITRHMPDGKIEQRVHPCMLPANSPVGVDDVYNAIVVEGDAVDRVTLEGRGAGGGPTASSVIADICDLARGVKYHPFTLPVDKLEDRDFSSLDELKSAYYMRLTVLDAPGVLAEITRIFSQENISLCSFLQRSHQPKQGVQIVITTHITQEAAMQRATRAIAARPEVTEPPHIIRIENFAE